MSMSCHGAWLVLAAVLAFVAVSDVSVPYSKEVYATDASLSKGAITARDVSAEVGRRYFGLEETRREPTPCWVRPLERSVVSWEIMTSPLSRHWSGRREPRFCL